MRKVFNILNLINSPIELFNKVILSVVLLNVMGMIVVQAQTVTDFDGNLYNTVTIGTQTWMKENLKTTKYNDGTTIPNVTDNTAWTALTTGAYSDYNNTTANSDTYGRLYNWFTVDNNGPSKVVSNGGKNVCPIGWHVPSDDEWTTLTNFLGGLSIAGGKLKETGIMHWTTPNTDATNESNFTALPGGARDISSTFSFLWDGGNWWSSTGFSSTTAWSRYLGYNYAGVSRYLSNKPYGFSVRCVKDIITGITNPSTSSIEVYPNPVSGILNIKYKDENFETVSILNSLGLELTKEKAIMPILLIDFSKYASGLYFLKFIKSSGEISMVKIVNY